ncbi:MAG: HNH endonuclease [Casimicrobiaceae bacterium]
MTFPGLRERDRHVCAYCGGRYHHRDLSRDHIVPASRGGRDTWMRLHLRCSLPTLLPLAMGALTSGAMVVAMVVTVLPARFAASDAGRDSLGIGAWRALGALPDIRTGVALTWVTDVGATLPSFVLACCLCAWAMTPGRLRPTQVIAAAVAAVPPAALAAGVALIPALTWMGALYVRSPKLLGIWLVDNNFGRFFGFVRLGTLNPERFYELTLLWGKRCLRSPSRRGRCGRRGACALLEYYANVRTERLEKSIRTYRVRRS